MSKRTGKLPKRTGKLPKNKRLENEKKFHFSRKSMFIEKGRFFFYTNYNDIGISLKEKVQLPDDANRFQISVKLFPFKIIVFNKWDRILWIGDRKWKRNLRID